jgi:hypothetical protein
MSTSPAILLSRLTCKDLYRQRFLPRLHQSGRHPDYARGRTNGSASAPASDELGRLASLLLCRHRDCCGPCQHPSQLGSATAPPGRRCRHAPCPYGVAVVPTFRTSYLSDTRAVPSLDTRTTAPAPAVGPHPLHAARSVRCVDGRLYRLSNHS